MNTIEELIQKECPEGVEYLPLGEVCEILDSQRKPVAKGKRSGGHFPYYGANGIQDYVDSYIFDGTFILMGEDGSVINPDRTPILNWAIGKIWVNNHAHVLKEKDNIALLRYVFYALQCVDVFDIVRGTPPKLNQANMRAIEIPVPPLSVQHKIVEILDKFTSLEAELQTKLQAELEARKKQYEYYRNQLLKGDETWEQTNILSLLCQPITDGPHETPKLLDEGIPFLSAESMINGHLDFTHARGYISREYDMICAKKYKPAFNDVYMCKSGSTTGKVAINDTDKDFNIWSPLAAMRVNSNNSARFLYYLLQTDNVQTQVAINASHGSQPNLSMRKLEQFIVSVPSLTEQQRIVTILDKFEALINDQTASLAAEMKARHQQYEYYRDRLLTFSRKEN